MKFITIFSVITIAVSAVLPIHAQKITPKKQWVIGMSQCNLGEPWRVQMNADIKKAAEKHPELKVIYKDAQNDSLKQVSHVEEFIGAGVDLLIISPKEAAPLTPPVVRAYKKGIPVIVLDRRILGDTYTCFIGADNKKIGEAAGKWIVEILGGKGNVVELKGLMTSTPGQDRHSGFRKGIAGSDISVIFEADMKWLEPDARKEMESALARYDDIDLVYAHNDPGAHGAYLAAKAARREKGIMFVGIDALAHEGQVYVKQGILAASFEYPTGGREAIDVAIDILNGKKVDKEISLSSKVYTKENIDKGGEVLGAAPEPAGKTYTYSDLVNKMIDLEALATPPVDGESLNQWTSYDRASRYDAETGTYIAWNANRDNAGHIRMEGKKMVMAEMDGPGVIWKIWSAQAAEGHVKIYLDGSETPAVDLPFNGYFNGKNEPFTYNSLVFSAAGNGRNSYIPIPYQKSCKIVADEKWGNYYYFIYETFPEGTTVPTFKRQLPGDGKKALETVNTYFASGMGTYPYAGKTGQQKIRKRVTVKPGKTAVVADVNGSRAITGIKIKPLMKTADNFKKMFRELAIQMTWDDSEQPQVWAPLGDFFGTAPGMNLYKSLPLGMTEEGCYSYWYMPFASRGVIEIVNDGDTPYPLEVSIMHVPETTDPAELCRFHAKWHRDAFLPENPQRRAIDWTILKTDGRGRFCGTVLHVWNPKGHWWGEGDEKFFVDGEKFPSFFGTGSEDYFGYAWCNPGLFQGAYINQTYNENNNTGHVSVNRWQIQDNVPFHTAFEGAIEKYFPNDRPTLYACVAYWYLKPGGNDPYKPVPVKERTEYYTTKEK
jgi:ABC-type sugar transport system substrate-binding protein